MSTHPINTAETAPRQLHFNAFLNACGHHQAAWRHPDSAVEQLGSIEHYERLAQTAEAGLFDAVFFADGHSAGNPAAGPRWFFEPLTALAAMARSTSRIGLISTVSTTFYTPYHAARMLASLDHLSAGRIGWNVVTSMFDAEARNHSMDSMPASPERYARAAEFIDVALALWDSWADDAVLADRSGFFADPEKVRPINHDGEHFGVAGPLNVPRGPQGRPVLFQAGASESGRQLAARHAEGIYAVAYDLASGQDYYADLKQRIAAEGRDPSKVAIMPGLVTYLGSTEVEALARQAEVDALLPTEQSLAQLGMFIGQDCSEWDLDAPVPALPPASEFTGPQGRYATILRIVEAERPTVGQLLGRLAAGGGHCTMVGTPEQVADSIERWFTSGAADGFNLMPPMLPDSLEEFVDRVVPVLQRRGLYRTEYSTHTLRGHLGLERPEA
ncbi:LLM class flavin-dependent oxidoreductase [Glutamicibacter sp. BW78]|uniref:LLM class flavin-dependent oxidoreductase n=1 Tax=Glutamicibacter sp. BW78 TaxID=2024403 RepID=UPI000BB747A4|nr:LLM class flavin-dependent oxidoreductase [Glutamicibacter sp. BW78]PCC25586.1 LLM class flavin-dependent oxidoreductase [Glutamicibacter sp. BW78]